MEIELKDNKVTDDMIELYKVLGKEGIQKIYDIMGTRKFSIKPLIAYIKRECIIKDLRESNKTIKEIAIEQGVCRNTVYAVINSIKNSKEG